MKPGSFGPVAPASSARRDVLPAEAGSGGAGGLQWAPHLEVDIVFLSS